ncbi:unnamed protein product [Macrosiphum euphorbiae]|uniref:FAR1 domain-containing protein n=1 Tax=Macrosiphum euphorbiae TaxID=13131 RepID=A0AAV0VRW6_9HEMI|nr:unnamed protein product [Macrosiphum euphorbiae]
MDDNKNDIRAGQIFNSYEQFFETFCEENYQPLVITDNNYKRQVTILCQHGYNRPSKSTGKRTILHYNYIGCKAKITCFKPSNSTRVKISSVNLEHNHEISRTAFGTTRMNVTGEQTDV